MTEDYRTEADRVAYKKGIVARIHGHAREDNPYIPIEGLGYPLEHFAWLKGYDEKGSIKEKAK